MKKHFRQLIYVVGLCYLVLIFLPYLWRDLYSYEINSALGWNGLGSVLNLYGPVPYILLAITVISLVGLHQYKNWGRTLFLVVTLISGFLSPFFGLAVQGNYDSFFGYFFAIGSGAILAASYFSEVSGEFEKRT